MAARRAAARTAAARRLWPAWHNVDEWEEKSSDELGARLGDLLIVLWSVRRFAVLEECETMIDDLLDEALTPGVSSPMVEDLVEFAFAIGAAWAHSQEREGDVRRVPMMDPGVVPIHPFTSTPGGGG